MFVAYLSGNGNLNLDTSLDVDDDLLDDLGGSVQVDETLVDSVQTCQYPIPDAKVPTSPPI
jgi:hypothetical protein